MKKLCSIRFCPRAFPASVCSFLKECKTTLYSFSQYHKTLDKNDLVVAEQQHVNIFCGHVYFSRIILPSKYMTRKIQINKYLNLFMRVSTLNLYQFTRHSVLHEVEVVCVVIKIPTMTKPTAVFWTTRT